MDGWIMWVIMGLLVGIMIIFLGFSYFKDKKKNKVVIYKKIELKNITEKTSREISLRINTIVEINQEQISNFVPSIGLLTMKEINTIAKDMLKDIYKSSLFKKIYLAEDYDPEFATRLKHLIDTKSNHWNKKCAEDLAYFVKLEDELKSDEKYEETKNDILVKVKKSFSSKDNTSSSKSSDASKKNKKELVETNNESAK